MYDLSKFNEMSEWFDLFIVASIILFVVTFLFPEEYKELYSSIYSTHFLVIRFGSLVLLIIGILGRSSLIRNRYEISKSRDYEPAPFRNFGLKLIFLLAAVLMAVSFYMLIVLTGQA